MSISGLAKTARKPAEPSAKPSINWNAEAHRLTISFYGRTSFSANVRVIDRSGAEAVGAAANVKWEEVARPAEPVYLGYYHGPEYAGPVPNGLQAVTWVINVTPPQSGQRVVVNGMVQGIEPFACSTDITPGIIRGSVGNCVNSLNRGIYDRNGDWVISVAQSDEYSTRFLRQTTLTAEFALEASGPQVKLHFQPDFYRIHRGYFYWNPAKKAWGEPVAGWTSWEAYHQSVTEKQVLEAVDFMARELLPYGYNVVQIDDGYQIYNQNDPKPLGPGETVADFWVNSNERFPSGLAELARRIKSKGLTPGIWLSTSLPLGMPKEWYVLGDDDKPYRGPWVNYAVNGCLEPAVEHGFRRTIRGLRMQGWRYFKIDTIRHMLYDSYLQIPEYWRRRNEDPRSAFRVILQSIAEEIGPSIYMLSCWGVIPELCDITDGCRIGADVSADWDSVLAAQKFTCQFNYLNNIVWRNDPDYMCFRVPVEQARTWATMVALTGMQLMISDPPQAYDEARLDILRKVAPPLPVHPTTLAPMGAGPEFWALEIGTPEPYMVLGRIAWEKGGLSERNIRFSELGLPSDRYLVFDFWNERLIGEYEEEFLSEQLNEGECRVYSIRPSLDRPQVVSTNRHIGQGAFELEKVVWRANALSGKMKLPPGKPFGIYIYVPEGYRALRAVAREATFEQDSELLKVTLSSERGGSEDWSVQFEQA